MIPFYESKYGVIYHGDCLEIMPQLEPVDTILTDPPYGLEFRGEKWDKLQTKQWQGKREAWQDKHPDSHIGNRLCKGPRYYAGTEAQQWHQAWADAALFCVKPGAAFMAFGGTRTWHRLACAIEDAGWKIKDMVCWLYGSGFPKSLDISKAIDKMAGHWRGRVGELLPDDDKRSFGQHYERNDKGDPITAAAAAWDGWGTALKPAWEPIICAMKPLEGTFAENALKHGVAGLNVDGGKIDAKRCAKTRTDNRIRQSDFHMTTGGNKENEGRWPANVMLDEHAAALLGASRFFYTAKAQHEKFNTHPTVKPLDLMRYLAKLTATPTGGTILDPFMGSGTTCIAAGLEGRRFIGIEMQEEYCEIAARRIEEARTGVKAGEQGLFEE